ncbi:hypothetical protein L3X38_016974 [Prunus dulcis]|uniref:RING-type domain-containing protein n=1 Tax=Prunus dulcis TaxID=3755 RepID=A0AAD4ZAB5_PRUDU|nr:hypothetical protein L3X38_016974 [Prunus dulcis]
MANDMLKHGDDPSGSTSPLQWLKESEIPVKNDEVANFMGTLNNRNASGVDDITMPCTTTPFSLFPFGDMYGMTNSYAMEMPLTGINLMTDVTPFSNSQNPFFDYDSVYAEGHTPVLPSPVSNFLGLEGKKTEFSQYHTLDYSVPPDNVVSATSDVHIIQNSYFDRKLVTAKGNSAAALESIQRSEELNSNTGRPQLLRNFISDGVSNTVPCHAIDGVDIALNKNFMASEVQEDCPDKFDASLLTLGIGTKTEDLSKSNRSGINVTNNFGRVPLPQPNTFYGRKEDRGSLNPSSDVAGGFPCLQNNVGGFAVMKNNMPQDDDQHHFLMPGNRNVCLGVEGNWDTRSAYIDPPNDSFQYSPAVSFIPVGSSLAELPDSGWSRANGLALSPSSSTSTCLTVSETSRNLFSDSSMVFPPICVTRSTSLHDEFGKLSTANQGIAAQVAERGHVPGKFWFSQLPSNSCQRQVIGAVQSSTDLSRSMMTGEEVPITKLNRNVQGSSALVGTSLKRVAEEPPEAASQAHKKRRAQSSVGPFAPNLPLLVPSLHLSNASNLTVPGPTAPSLPHQVKSTALLPPLPQTSQSLPLQAKGTASLQPVSENAPSLPTLVRRTAVLPPLSQIAPSLPSQAKTIVSHQPLPKTASYLRLKGSTASLPSVSQNARSLSSMHQIVPPVPSEAKTTQSHPPLPQAAPNLRSRARSITSLPTLSQNAPSLTPLPRMAPPLSSQPSSAPPLPQKIWTAKPLPEKSQTASPLPAKSQTASPLPAKSQTASPLHLSPQIAPPLPSQPQTASTFHIKWQGFGQTQTQPIGHKCLICKRDLSFTPEGPVFVPAIRPVVAVLPCGHTFHDHCLRLITPEEEVKNPPCIPCAIGES